MCISVKGHQVHSYKAYFFNFATVQSWCEGGGEGLELYESRYTYVCVAFLHDKILYFLVCQLLEQKPFAHTCK